ncbi:MAG: lytic transglycosylase domain-containing protein [Bdellovibrionales bacterium]|nr:lytic transglycosylase domain-containing protein [Bdellovibrionales bacterium]
MERNAQSFRYSLAMATVFLILIVPIGLKNLTQGGFPWMNLWARINTTLGIDSFASGLKSSPDEDALKEWASLDLSSYLKHQEILLTAAYINELDPDLLRAIILLESGFKEHAISPRGAIGLMQLMPRTAKELGVIDPYNPIQNIAGGAKYFAYLLKHFEGNMELALAAYNAGPAAVRKYNGIPPFKETQHYIEKVTYAYKKFRGDV